MPITVQIPTPMREPAGGRAEVTVEGGTVREALDDLVRQYPGLAAKVFDNGRIRLFLNVFVNFKTGGHDEDIRSHDGLDTVLPDGVVLDLTPGVGGG